jgi:nucleoside-diphosphate-sugar epimerase
MIGSFLKAAGVGPPAKSIPEGAAYALAWVLETGHRLLRLETEPRLTRFVVSQLTTAHWFDISRARGELGYSPRVTIEEGLERLGEWFRSRDQRPNGD